MPLFRPTELKDFLSSLGRGANRSGANSSLSQNFLIDGNVVKKIVDLVPINEEILEIGPGPGVLTEELLSRQFKITAVEKDSIFAQALPRLALSQNGGLQNRRLSVSESDICSYSLSQPSVVVGNIPYGISKEICLWMIDQRVCVREAVLMVQREFAEKLLAAPGAAGFGALSVLMQYFFDMKIEMIVSPSCFWPRPKATSAVVTFKKRNAELSAAQEEILVDFVPRAYLHRRKKVAKALEIEQTGELFEAHVDTLDVAMWVKLIICLGGRG